MARRPASTSRLARALRAGGGALVVAGYLAALGATTTAGQGLRLLPHLALDHTQSAPSRPGLVEDERGDHPVLTTLRERETHRHGRAAHTHEHDGGLEAPPDLFPEHGAIRTEGRDDGLHEHDGVFHSHDAPPPEPAVVLVVSLDQHHVPTAPAVPAPEVWGLDGGLEAHGSLHSVDLSVETPPPIGRG